MVLFYLGIYKYFLFDWLTLQITCELILRYNHLIGVCGLSSNG